MALISVRISPAHAVALRSRKLHRVRRPLLTLPNRYGKRCYHQGESMFSGASLPPHLCLRRLPTNMSWKHNRACQCSVTWRTHSLTRSMHAVAQGTQWIKVSLPTQKLMCSSQHVMLPSHITQAFADQYPTAVKLSRSTSRPTTSSATCPTPPSRAMSTAPSPLVRRRVTSPVPRVRSARSRR